MGTNLFIGGSFPLNLANLRLWYKADGTLFQDLARTVPVGADGDDVASWTEENGSGTHMQQGGLPIQPVWRTNVVGTKPAVQFDGVNDWMAASVSISQPTVVFLVGQSSTTGRYIYDGSNAAGSRNALGHGIGTAGHMTAFAGTNLEIVETNPTGNDIWMVVFNGASSLLWRGSDGVNASGNVGTQGITGVTLGSLQSHLSGFLSGFIAEYMLFNALLSTARQNEIGNYLQNKYSLPWTDI